MNVLGVVFCFLAVFLNPVRANLFGDLLSNAACGLTSTIANWQQNFVQGLIEERIEGRMVKSVTIGEVDDFVVSGCNLSGKVAVKLSEEIPLGRCITDINVKATYDPLSIFSLQQCFYTVKVTSVEGGCFLGVAQDVVLPTVNAVLPDNFCVSLTGGGVENFRRSLRGVSSYEDYGFGKDQEQQARSTEATIP